MNDVDIKWIKNKEEALQYYMNRMKKSNSLGIFFLMLFNILFAPVLIFSALSKNNLSEVILNLTLVLIYIIGMHLLLKIMYKENLNKKEDFSYYDYLKNKNKPKKQFKLI